MLLQNSTAQKAIYPEGIRNISQDIESQRLQIKALKTNKQDKTQRKEFRSSHFQILLYFLSNIFAPKFQFDFGQGGGKYKNAV